MKDSSKERTMRRWFIVLAVSVITVFAKLPAYALDKVSFATNWLAQAEHGGFYQAVADGTYARYGLDVTIVQGGPQSNVRLALAAGRFDFSMGADLTQTFTAVEQKIPIVTVASMFQIDPIIFMSHPAEGLDRFEDLPKATAFVANDMQVFVYPWLEQAHGFRKDRIKAYNFSSAPFILDKKSIQQGLLTSEPYEVERQGGFTPNVFLLRNYGYDSYSTAIETLASTIEQKPDLVQRFVDASIIGWYHYLYGDNNAANAAIKRDNPEMTDGEIAYAISKIKEYGVVDSGDSLVYGIGVMTDARIKSFFDKMVKANIFKADLDYRKGYTLRFVGKKVGLELRPRQ